MNNADNITDGNITAGLHPSFWVNSTDPISFEPLQQNISTDVVVVGAGIAGLSVAYNIARSGQAVIVVEDGNVGSGETGRTTAHIVNALDDRYYELERVFGEEGSKLAAESHSAAISFIEKTAQEENIACDFERVSGYLFLDPSDEEKSLDKEFDAATRAGLKVTRHAETPFLKNHQKHCLEFSDQGQFHPMKYLKGLAGSIIKYGGKIFTQTRVVNVTGQGIETQDGFRVSAKHIVVATNSPINSKGLMHMKQFAYRTYVIGATIKKNSLPRALWWDTGDFEANSEIPPYHYVRTQAYSDEFDLLLCGGEDHPTGLPEAMERNESSSYSKLIGWAKARFDFGEVVYRWSGQVLEPMDGLAYIGLNPKDESNIYIVTGDSGNGITHGTIAGIMVPELIAGHGHPWQQLYDPSRIKFLKAGKTFLKEFIGGWFQYKKYLPKDADKIALSEIAPGEAQVVEMEKEKFGIYRDMEKALHVVSATCTHLGCVVRWNSDEKSWDCPCHGSRFAPDGKILNGPARKDLLYYKEESGHQ